MIVGWLGGGILWYSHCHLVSQCPSQPPPRGLLDVTGPGGHVDEDNDEQHHHGQRGQDDGGHLLPGLLHGLLALLLVLGGLLLGLPFQLSHGDGGGPALLLFAVLTGPCSRRRLNKLADLRSIWHAFDQCRSLSRAALSLISVSINICVNFVAFMNIYKLSESHPYTNKTNKTHCGKFNRCSLLAFPAFFQIFDTQPRPKNIEIAVKKKKTNFSVCQDKLRLGLVASTTEGNFLFLFTLLLTNCTLYLLTNWKHKLFVHFKLADNGLVAFLTFVNRWIHG